MYECEHQNKTLRKRELEYNIIVCNKCYAEFTNASTRALSLAKQILTLTNKKIENMPIFMSGKGPDDCLNSWHGCNKDVLEHLKKLKIDSENIKDEEITLHIISSINYLFSL